MNRESLLTLVVESEQTVRNVICDMLEVSGHKAKKVSDNIEAEMEILKQNYDLMFYSDVRFPPDFNSEDFIKKIKSVSPKTKLVLVSSLDRLIKLKSLKEEGKIYDFILKPFDYNSVINVVDNVASLKDSCEEAYFCSKENPLYNKTRRHWRLADSIDVDYVIWNPDKWMSSEKLSGVAVTKNISPLGACITIPYFVKPDYVSAMSFSFTKLNAYACATGEVRWVRAADKLCDIGIEFISIDKESEAFILKHMDRLKS